MDTPQEIREILHGAERSLRTLMEACIKDQRYGDVAEVARAAERVSRLLSNGSLTGTHAAATTTRQSSARTTRRNNGGMGSGNGKSKRVYPRFERDGDKLVKIGWSKKNKSTYEHRAPKEAVVSFVRHLTSSGAPGEVFAVDDLLPVPDVANDCEVPTYQVYLSLAWLRDAGVINKKGRDGYVLMAPNLDESEFGVLWAALPAQTTHQRGNL